MKTKNNNMKIMKTESTANEQERKEAKYKPVTPVILDNVSEDVTFIRSADVCKLLNVSNSTLRNLRAAQAIPFYKLGGTFLYNKEEIMNYLAITAKEYEQERFFILQSGDRPLSGH